MWLYWPNCSDARCRWCENEKYPRNRFPIYHLYGRARIRARMARVATSYSGMFWSIYQTWQSIKDWIILIHTCTLIANNATNMLHFPCGKFDCEPPQNIHWLSFEYSEHAILHHTLFICSANYPSLKFRIRMIKSLTTLCRHLAPIACLC